MRYSKQREFSNRKRCRPSAITPRQRKTHTQAAPRCPGLSPGTVYRNLNSLVDMGRVRRVSIPGQADRFDHTLCWHSHLYCTVCGSVVDAQVDEQQLMQLVQRQQGIVQECAVTLFGLCADCCARQAAVKLTGCFCCWISACGARRPRAV